MWGHINARLVRKVSDESVIPDTVEVVMEEYPRSELSQSYPTCKFMEVVK